MQPAFVVFRKSSLLFLLDGSKIFFCFKFQYFFGGRSVNREIYAFKFFKNKLLQKMIYEMKYNGNKETAFVLGIKLEF
tara:strand:- start:1236 stop:1469 length:234 start_codon:yes stop_codon:yes gene_type:complete